MEEGKHRLTLDLNRIRILIFLAAHLDGGLKLPLRRMRTIHPNFGFGMGGGFMPAAAARSGGFTSSNALGGLSLFPSFFNVQLQGFPDATVYGTTSGFPYGFHGFHGNHARWLPSATARGQLADNVLKNLFFLIGFLVVLALLLG
ncbi:hypothetical protein OIU77_003403 [Salix suchowensis]|uniref:Uncharacterized protein n=1 Tax=Salix suchowensis TaxID=1278906 RepID=A0ABQ9B1T7_9ROSI|nr:hypothetical protein OIU77_003403 [Salix suchowensis]KAJ6367012.1 hypothetical protein OIU77_003403 [Salix suchowensis]KAJ6367013.1 hypothetical protein OIU77_003403 [Salix suchowensis]